MRLILLFLAFTCSTYADSLEFRLINLKTDQKVKYFTETLSKEQHQVFIASFRKLLNRNLIADETSIMIPIEDGHFKYNDTKDFLHVDAMDTKGEVRSCRGQSFGTIIDGTVRNSPKGINISFSYYKSNLSYHMSTSEPYNIIPSFDMIRASLSVLLKTQKSSPEDTLINDWAILGVSNDPNVKGEFFVAVKYHK
ncbi:hypothetical protein Rhal01_02522 [Rubritalea halochordaticola]|uniref:Uncharacterized protein n=1 Tax=Rubritalea halochordaticola TaxID=714537 RepID=A0ABP9V426_9BACT